jgi:hypothetical protein
VRILLISAGVAGTHAVIDYSKVKAENESKKYMFFFIVDQIAHLSILVMAAVLIAGIGHNELKEVFFLVNWYFDPAFIIGICLLIIATYVNEIAIYQLQRKTKLKFKPNKKRMVKNLVIVGSIYAAILIFGVYEIAAFALASLLV